jgi:hypothetical protein
MAVRTTGLSSLCELGSVSIRVAVFADLRGSLELSLAGAGRGFVTCGAGNGAMSPQEREFGFRMIETAHVRPRLHIVTSLTTKSRSIRAAPGHAVFEFTFMRINVAGGAALILKMEGEHLLCWSPGSHLVTIIARHGHVCARECKASVAMLCNRKCGAVKILNGMAAFASVLIGCGLKLPFMRVLVAIQAGSKLHFVNRIFARWKMAFCAIYGGMLAQQRVVGAGMLFYAKE